MPNFGLASGSKTNEGIALIIAAGLAAVNTGLLIVLYRKYKELNRRLEDLKAEETEEIVILKASIATLQQQLLNKKRLEAAAPATSTSTLDSEYQDATDQQQQIATTMTTTMSGTQQQNSAADRKAILIAQVDQLYEECKYSEIYDLLKNQEADSDADVLWRLARACYQIASPLESKNSRKKIMLDEGHKHASTAHKLKPGDFFVLKWLAALTGARTDFLGTKEKIEQGNVFKALLDQCLGMQPADYALLHMRGRFSFSVASLSWLERKAAAAFFATPPEATYADAIRDFTAVDKLKPEWLENLVYLAKAHIAKGEKKEAVKYLKRAVQLEETTEDGEETEATKEAKELLKKHGK